jgi:hypothetical protein
MLGVRSRAITAPARAGAVFFVLTETLESGAIPELRWFYCRAAPLTLVEDSDTMVQAVSASQRVCSWRARKEEGAWKDTSGLPCWA